MLTSGHIEFAGGTSQFRLAAVYGSTVTSLFVSTATGFRDVFTLPVAGTYTVTVEHAGFKAAVRSRIELLGGQTYRVDARLEIGAVTEKVEVSAASEMVNTEQPDVASTVGDPEI